MHFEPGDEVTPIFTQPLPKKEVAPKLVVGKNYTVKEVFTDKEGHQHLDVGLPNDVTEIRSFHTDEILPPGKRWCHPNRFILYPKF